MTMLIKNALIVNAAGEASEIQDILIEKGRIAAIGKGLSGRGVKVIDAGGKKVLPGLIDIHAHLREPGQEEKETIETGSRAAAHGGFTTVFCMPNTRPAIDNAEIVEAVKAEARRVGLVNVIPIGAVTKGQQDQELVDMFEMRAAGCLALSDDGKSVNNSQLMLLAMKYAQMARVLLIQHCEDPLLSRKGVMNEGYQSTVLGMRGDPAPSETVILARDIELSAYLKIPLHFAHLSLRRSCDLVRRAKADGIPVTAECCPHHFTLTEEAVAGFDANTKVNPPLRSADDVEALKEALADGTLDCIATDHAPHSREDKERGFDGAPPGMSGFETAFGLAMTELVHTKVLTLAQLTDKMSHSPARLMGLETKGEIAEGRDADLVIVDPDEEWTVDTADFYSKGKNSPFAGRRLKGRVRVTICGGKVVYDGNGKRGT
ncbi:MAG: dihydroorotase [Candidatus Omnitrophota bacterium]